MYINSNFIKIMTSEQKIFHTLHGERDLASLEYPSSMEETIHKYGDAAAMYWATFLYKELELLGLKIDKGDIFVDLGANIGISSRYAEQCIASEIYAFEPDPVIGEIYKKNCPTAKLYQNAISNKNGIIELYNWPYNERDVGPKYKVETITIKDVLNIVGKPIDYLKMDIEGFEENVFDEISYEDCSKIKKMFIEYHTPNKIDEFCKKLHVKGFNTNAMYTPWQCYVYARRVA